MLDPISLVADILSISSGGMPMHSISSGVRMIPSFFHKRKGLSKAKLKKLMMRKRRRFVDTVVMEHEKRIQKQNIERRIKEAKERIEKIKARPRKSLVKKLKTGTRASMMKNRDHYEYNKKDSEEQTQEEHQTAIQKIIADKQRNQGSSWSDRVNGNKDSSRGI